MSSSTGLFGNRAFVRLWVSTLAAAVGAQVTLLALPLTAAVLLHASPVQMSLLVAAEVAPHALLALPAGVWLDRMRKLPVYIAGEAATATLAASVPVAWWLGWLSITWLCVVGFGLGCVQVFAGTAGQIVLTQVVPRERLVEAHSRNAMANSSIEVIGPGLAGALIKVLGAPVALAIDAAMSMCSVVILRGIRIKEELRVSARGSFLADLQAGLRFVWGTKLLRTLALTAGGWQVANYAALSAQILFATRDLKLSESQLGLCFAALGAGSIVAGAFAQRLTTLLGPGRCLALGPAACGLGWALGACALPGTGGVILFVGMLFGVGFGGSLVYVNFLALRQAATPEPMLARMTSTMRFLALLPAGPGALLGGWLAETATLRAPLAAAAALAVMVAVLAWQRRALGDVRELPRPAVADRGAPMPVEGASQA